MVVDGPYLANYLKENVPLKKKKYNSALAEIKVLLLTKIYPM